jgi:hypothetical protein
MTRKGSIYVVVALVALATATIGIAQDRGKAEMKAGSGMISVEYGRPALQGRDMLGMLKVGSVWRMGMNQATVLTTPVDLMFGSTRVPKGSYRLLLERTGDSSYEMIFNKQTEMMGSRRDEAQDEGKVAMKVKELSSPVESFTIKLMPGSGGGTFAMHWGPKELSAAFTMK